MSRVLICPDCNEEVETSHGFCPNCGAEFKKEEEIIEMDTFDDEPEAEEVIEYNGIPDSS